MTQKTWVLPVDDDGVISFPEDLMKVLEWEEGTVLEWTVAENGGLTLKKASNQEAPTDDAQPSNS